MMIESRRDELGAKQAKGKRRKRKVSFIPLSLDLVRRDADSSKSNSLVRTLLRPLHKFPLHIIPMSSKRIQLHLLVIRRQILPSNSLHPFERRTQSRSHRVCVKDETSDGFEGGVGFGYFGSDGGDEERVDDG